MSIRVTLLWGDDIISTEALQRAESRALEIINQAGTTPEESKRGFDLWKQRKRGEALPAAEIKHLYDVWVNADHAAEAVLEEGLTDRKLVCAELELNGHD